MMRNLRKGALQPNFKDEEYEVLEVEGGEITVKSKETGKIYKRNSSHLKTLLSSKSDDSDEKVNTLSIHRKLLVIILCLIEGRRPARYTEKAAHITS